MRKRKARVFLILMLISVLIVGCNSITTSGSGNTEESVVEKVIPTEEQIEILRSCGVSYEYINEFKKEGMPFATREFVETAQIMLAYLEEKYDEPFGVSGGSIPGILGGTHNIQAYATTGDYANQKFDVRYVEGENGEMYCEDEYYALTHSAEAEAYIQQLAAEAGVEFKVVGILRGYTADIDIMAEVEDYKKIDFGKGFMFDTLCFANPSMSESDAFEQIEIYSQVLENVGIRATYTLYGVKEEEYYNQITTYENLEYVPSELNYTLFQKINY